MSVDEISIRISFVSDSEIERYFIFYNISRNLRKLNHSLRLRLIETDVGAINFVAVSLIVNSN